MRKIAEYLKLIVFVAGLLIGVQLPGFVDQYGKNLEARAAESGRSIGEFQDDADKYFGGDINELIVHYKNKPDPVIVSGGDSIEVLVSRNQALNQALNDFRRSLSSAYLHVFVNPLEEIRTGAWSNYTYQVTLNGSAIVFGLASGLLLLMLFELTVYVLLLGMKTFFKRGKLPEKKTAC